MKENKGKENVYIDHDELDIIEDELNIPRGSLGSIPDYARVQGIEVAKKILEMQKRSLFREGLYYTVICDIEKNTDFNVQYGNAHADLRAQWFHTAVIEALGQIQLNNHAHFVKTIGDASLLVFSSIGDIIKWSEQLNIVLEKYNQEYAQGIRTGSISLHIPAEIKIDKLIDDFTLNVRRLIHIGEVQYVDEYDPLSLAISQTFKVEKEFARTDLGCTGRVPAVAEPALIEYGYKLRKNKTIDMQGEKGLVMSYYIVKIDDDENQDINKH